VREEAVTPLRFAAHAQAAAKLAAPLLEVARAAPSSGRGRRCTRLARALDGSLLKRLAAACGARRRSRAVGPIERLAQQPAPAAAER